MIKQRERKIMTIARNANMRANGASTDKPEKLQNKNLEQLLQRKYFRITYSLILRHKFVYRTQQYGWREPYDSLTFGYNKSGMCKRTFFDHGHL